jgi:hypothetical protein
MKSFTLFIFIGCIIHAAFGQPLAVSGNLMPPLPSATALHRHMKPATVQKGATLQMSVTPKATVSPSQTNIMLAWDAWTNVFQQIESTTNLSSDNWQIETNVYPIWPTNVTLPNNQPQKLFRTAIIYKP